MQEGQEDEDSGQASPAAEAAPQPPGPLDHLSTAQRRQLAALLDTAMLKVWHAGFVKRFVGKSE